MVAVTGEGCVHPIEDFALISVLQERALNQETSFGRFSVVPINHNVWILNAGADGGFISLCGKKNIHFVPYLTVAAKQYVQHVFGKIDTLFLS